MKKNILSSCKINYKIYFLLLLQGFITTIYGTLRIYFLGTIPNTYIYSIGAQLVWVGLLYEIIEEGIILPLYHFTGEEKLNSKELENRITTGLITFGGIYFILFILMLLGTKPLLSVLSANNEIIDVASKYIKLESFAYIFSILSSTLLTGLITRANKFSLFNFIILKAILIILFDLIFVSNYSFSFKFGIIGVPYTNILINFLMVIFAIYLFTKDNIHILRKRKLSFKWLKKLRYIGGISSIESLVRNLAYIVMIGKMVNSVNEQGTYWIANSFIWGWLLLPVLSLGELIKKETSENTLAIKENNIGYLILTSIICFVWIVTIPFWKTFFSTALNYPDVDKVYNLVILLLPFYIFFAFQNIFDAVFYGVGKTNYMLFESVVTNIIYYGTAYILYINKLWIPSLEKIALLFGWGIIFDSIVSLLAYIWFRKKYQLKINNGDRI